LADKHERKEYGEHPGESADRAKAEGQEAEDPEKSTPDDPIEATKSIIRILQESKMLVKIYDGH